MEKSNVILGGNHVRSFYLVSSGKFMFQSLLIFGSQAGLLQYIVKRDVYIML